MASTTATERGSPRIRCAPNRVKVGLDLVDQLYASGSLDGYHLHGVRGDLLEKLDRKDEAADELRRAASLTQNESEQQLLLTRAERRRGAASES